MANRSKSRRRKKSTKRGAFGLLSLQLIAVVAFAALLTGAQDQRDAAVEALQTPNQNFQSTNFAIENSDDWRSQDPKFTQVISELWQAGF